MNRRRFLRSAATGLFLPTAFPALAQLPVIPIAKRSSSGGGGGGGGGLSIVQAVKGKSGAATSVGVTITPTAGNLLVLGVTSDTTDISTPSDNIGGTSGWTNIDVAVQGSNHCSIWYKKNVPSGITTVTLSGPDFIVGMFHEVSGASTTTPFTTGEKVHNSSGSGTNPQCGPVTNGTPASIYFAVMTDGDSGGAVTMNINGTGTTGTWNLFSSTNSQELDANNNQPGSMPNILVASSTARSHGWTIGASVGAAMVMACFHG